MSYQASIILCSARFRSKRGLAMANKLIVTNHG
jgi:hypothetical protein